MDQRKPKRSKTKTKKASSSKDERGQRTKRKLIDGKNLIGLIKWKLYIISYTDS